MLQVQKFELNLDLNLQVDFRGDNLLLLARCGSSFYAQFKAERMLFLLGEMGKRTAMGHSTIYIAGADLPLRLFLFISSTESLYFPCTLYYFELLSNFILLSLFYYFQKMST